jgi:hypothetical protein
LVACIEDGCNCPPSKSYDTKVSDFEITALDTSGFNTKEISENVYKNSFGIRINILYNLQRTAIFNAKNNFSQLGFSSAYACSCLPDQFNSLNKINAIKITVRNTGNQETIDVTENFKSYLYGTEISLIEFINSQESFYDYWSPNDTIELELDLEDNIPNTAIFSIEFVLSDGENIVKESQLINFIQ